MINVVALCHLPSSKHYVWCSFIGSGDPAFQRPQAKRLKYPEPKETPSQVNFLSLITKLIANGELSSFISKGIYPSPIHEGLSELQRKAETAIAYPLLDKAAQEPKGSEMRLMYVTVYNVTCWNEQRARLTYKPVKPVQNETFEYVDPDGKYKLLVEEVLQNRDQKTSITCWKAWGKEWSLEFHMSPKTKFTIMTGPALEYNANCVGEIKFADGDVYTTTLAPGVVTSLTSTPQVFNYKGTSYVTNVATKLRSEADLTEPGLLSGGKKHQVKGVLTKDGKKASDLLLGGKWDEKFTAGTKGGEETVLYELDTGPRPEKRTGLNEFAMSLNSLPKELAEVLPPTDSRFRPDVRAVENGEFAKADVELQRVSALNYEHSSKGEDLSCKGRWFAPAPEGSYLSYRYKGGYWEARAARAKGDAKAFADCPDVYGAQSLMT